jgi:AcrR family transcriptional regulator
MQILKQATLTMAPNAGGHFSEKNMNRPMTPPPPPFAKMEIVTARTAKGQAAVDRILNASIELLAHEGHAGLSMRKVAERLNMGLSAVQRHFPTWEALFQAMMTRVTAEYVRVFDEHLNETRASRLKQFENVLNYLVREIKRPVTQSLFAQLWALAQTNDYVRKIMMDMYEYERGVFEFFIAELNPGLDKKDIARRAGLMVTQIEGLMILIPQQTRFPTNMAGIEQLCIENIIALAHAPSAAAKVA